MVNKAKLMMLVILGSLLVCLMISGGEAAANDGAVGYNIEDGWFRHHVIFLVDRSGSMIGYPSLSPRKVGDIKAFMIDRLPELLAAESSGFGVDIYDPDTDLATMFDFGVPLDNPLFMGDDFLHPRWILKPAGYQDLASSIPRQSTLFTAHTAAFRLAVVKLREQLDVQDLPYYVFNRTFLVMVTDGRANTAADTTEEMRVVHGGVVSRGDNFDPVAMKADRERAMTVVERLSNYYSLRSSPEGALESGRYRVLLKELVPHRLDGMSTLLEERPLAETELRRKSGGTFTGSLRLVPRVFERNEPVRYQIIDMTIEVEPRGSVVGERHQSGTGTVECAVAFDRAAIPDAHAVITVAAVRRDPVYGESVQRFRDEIRFSAEPNERVLGIFEVQDWMMVPGVSQGTIAILLAWAFIALILAFLAWLVFPQPKVGVKLVGSEPAGIVRSEPVIIDFNTLKRNGQHHSIVLRTVRFLNVARRWKWVPRGERRFQVTASTVLDGPESGAIVMTNNIVGVSASLRSSAILEDIANGSEVIIGLQPGGFVDYLGTGTEPERCSLCLSVTQRGSWWRRALNCEWTAVVRDQVLVSFRPEAPGVSGRLLSGVADSPTGNAGRRPVPMDQRVGSWLITPHMRRLADDSAGDSELLLEVATTSSRAFSLHRDARLDIVLYRHDGTAVLRNAVGLPEDLPSLSWESDDEGRGYFRLSGIRPEPISVPLKLDFSEVPVPPSDGDDYIIEARLVPVPGQDWNEATCSLGLRVGPDPRQTEMQLEYLVDDPANRDQTIWRSYDAERDGNNLSIAVNEPIRWSVGDRMKAVSALTCLMIDNHARTGAGGIYFRISSDIVVESQNPDYELEYASKASDTIIVGSPREEEKSCSAGTIVEINNEDIEGRPATIEISFDCGSVLGFPMAGNGSRPLVRSIPYKCVIPIVYSVCSDKGQGPQQRMSLTIYYTVERYSGDYVLAVDFGTSAIVAAFERAPANIRRRNREGQSMATLNLQQVYKERLSGAKKSQEDEVPNAESETPFIPSHLIWTSDQKLCAKEFVDLPCTVLTLGNDYGRAVLHLKSLILRGDTTLPKVGPVLGSWLNEDGEPQPAEQLPPVDGVVISAYRCLIDDYIMPILRSRGEADVFDRIIFACPNSFTLGHLRRLHSLSIKSFNDQFNFDYLSESNAVAVYCASNPDVFFPGVFDGDQRKRRILVYDIGAGTLDVTLSELEWGSEQEASQLKRMRVLFKYGSPVAGNKLDCAIARVVDRVIRRLCEKLDEIGVSLHYGQEIVRETGINLADDEHYPSAMMPIKRAIHQMKIDFTESYELHGETDAEASIHFSIVQRMLRILSLADPDSREVNDALSECGIRRPERNTIEIPLKADELLRSEEVSSWFAAITDSVFYDLKTNLSEMGISPSFDTLIISGRTARFPGVRKHLLGSIQRLFNVDIADINIPDLSHIESKEFVALGALQYGMSFGKEFRCSDKNVWSRYGIIFETGRGRRFIEFFGFATEADPLKGDEVIERKGMKVVLFNRTKQVRRSGGPVAIAVTFSCDPNRDLAEDDELHNRFVVLHTLGEDVLGNQKTFFLQLRIDENNHLEIVVNPESRPIRVGRIAYRPEGFLPQLDWPYRPLKML